MAGIGGQLSGVRWWRVLALGAAAAVSPIALMYLLVNLYAAGVSVYFGGDLGQNRLREDLLQPFANLMADGGLLALYAVLTAGAANVLTRATGAANMVQGVLLGLVSAAGIQLIGRAFGPFAAWELLAFPLLGAAGGWLGVALSRGALVRQESLYRATGALYAVDAPRDVATAVGENLAGPNEERVTLWEISPRAEDDGGLALESLGSWAPPGARPWPEGSRLTAERLPALADLRRWSYRVVRGEDLPPTERGAWAERGLRSALLVPLSSPGGTDGLLVVSSRRRRTFYDRRKVRAYLTVGAQAVLALENLRLVEEARRSGVIGERKRLAREIHDTLIQGFASIVVNLWRRPRARSGSSRSPTRVTSTRHARRRGRGSRRPGASCGRSGPGPLTAPPCPRPSRGSPGAGRRRLVLRPTWPSRGRPCRSRQRRRSRCSGWRRRP